MKNKYIFLLILMISLIAFAGCADEKVESVKERIVKVKVAELETISEEIYYFGFIEPEIIKTYALKTSGKISKIEVQSGDAIQTGEILVVLDDYEYTLSKNASVEQYSLSKLDLDKAEEARKFYEKIYNDTLSLYNEGAISKIKLDETKLQYDIKTKEVEQARKVINQARIDINSKDIILDDTVLLSEMDGYIVDVLNKEGELISAGYPVILARSEENVVNIGVTQEDVKRVKFGNEVIVESNGEYFNGIIEKINLMPNKYSKTYDIKVKIDKTDFIIGESCRVFLELEKITGIWMNINDIMNDGVDYVFVIENGRATRRDIELHEVNKGKVRVSNIKNGDEVVISGQKALAEGYKVKIVGDVNE